MAESKWADQIATIKPYVMRIDTPTGRGTGTVVPAPPGSGSLCVVTAWHVIEHAHEWHEPIKLVHLPTEKQIFLDSGARIVTLAPDRDQAIIEFTAEGFGFPTNLALFEAAARLLEGVEIGWLGFPSMAPNNLCFFHGHVSAWLESDEAYLVDGIAINGVSGGPAFIQSDDGGPVITGLLTAYRPSVATGNILPGVSLVRAINPLSRYYAARQETIEVAKVQELPKDTTEPGLPTGLK
jgi:hypothetical protein